MEFFPSVNQQQTEDNFSKTFLSRDLPEIVTFRKAQAAQNTKNSLHRMVREAIEEEKPVKEIILEIRESMTRTSIQEQDAIMMVCTLYALTLSMISIKEGTVLIISHLDTYTVETTYKVAIFLTEALYPVSTVSENSGVCCN